MDETLREIGELLLQSIPTVIFMVLLYGLYNVLVHKPLVSVLAERRSKTEGAIEKARADIAEAEDRTAEYEQKLRDARMAMFKSSGRPAPTGCPSASDNRRRGSNQSPGANI